MKPVNSPLHQITHFTKKNYTLQLVKPCVSFLHSIFPRTCGRCVSKDILKLIKLTGNLQPVGYLPVVSNLKSEQLKKNQVIDKCYSYQLRRLVYHRISDKSNHKAKLHYSTNLFICWGFQSHFLHRFSEKLVAQCLFILLCYGH